MTASHTTHQADTSNPGVSALLAAFLGILAMLAAMGLWWVGYAAGPAPFPPFDLADLVIRTAPGDVAVWAVANLQFQARNLALAGGIAAAAAFGALIGLALRLRPEAKVGALAGGLAGLAVLALPVANDTAGGTWSLIGLAIWFALTLAGPMALTGTWLERLAIDARDAARSGADWLDMHGNRTRRDVLKQAVSLSLGAGLGGWLAGTLLRNAGLGGVDTRDAVALPEIRDALVELAGDAATLPTPEPARDGDTSFVAPDGVRPRNTSNDDFYVIDISTRKPALPDDTWTLKVHGLVERELELTYLDLLDMPAVEQDGTLMCISFTYGNDLISSTRWTGVPLRDVLQRSGIGDGAVDLILHGAGGYSDSIPVAKALEPTTLLAYGMNGESLPREHGFPCRLYVPNIYGEKNVKWLQEIEIVDFDYQGYWQERGWSDEATILTIAAIDTPHGETTPDANGIVPVGGIAFAGSRGIQLVELQVDNGEWLPAELEPYDPELVWQRWRYDWDAQPGSHALKVRATDGDGILQDPTPRDPFPDGMTGLQSVRVRVS